MWYIPYLFLDLLQCAVNATEVTSATSRYWVKHKHARAHARSHTHRHTHIPWPDQTQLNDSKVSALDHHPLFLKNQQIWSIREFLPKTPISSGIAECLLALFSSHFFFYLLCYLSKSLCDSPFHRILPKTLAAARFVSEPRLSSSQQRAAILSPIQAPPRPPPSTATHSTKKRELFAGKKKSLIPFWGRRCVMRKNAQTHKRSVYILHTFYFNYLLN